MKIISEQIQSKEFILLILQNIKQRFCLMGEHKTWFVVFTELKAKDLINTI